MLKKQSSRNFSLIEISLILSLLGAGAYHALDGKGGFPNLPFLPKTRLDKTPACGSIKGADSAPLPLLWRLNEFYNTQSAYSLILDYEAAPCLKLRKTEVTFVSHVNGPDSMIYTTTGIAEITQIRAFQRDQLPPEEISKAGFKDFSRMDLVTLKSQTPPKPGEPAWIVVDFHLLRPAYLNLEREAAAELSYAQIVKAPDLESLLMRGGRLIDVRAKRLFDANHHPQALNVPYKIKALGAHAQFSDFAEKDEFNIRTLPPNLDTPLIFIGSSPFDLKPVRALLLAKAAGWKNLSWFKEGDLGRRHVELETEPSYPGVETIIEDDLAKIVQDRSAPIYDIRASLSFKESHIPGAQDVPYIEYSTEMNVLNGVKTADLLTEGDKFTLSVNADRNKPVVVYGADWYDHRPVKLAMFLKEQGWARVLWFRGGYQGWLERFRNREEGFKLEKSE